MTEENKENDKIIKDLVFKKETEVIVTVQAQKVIAGSKYSIKDFEAWALKEQKISLGGHNAVVFLEHMYNKEEEGSEAVKND